MCLFYGWLFVCRLSIFLCAFVFCFFETWEAWLCYGWLHVETQQAKLIQFRVSILHCNASGETSFGRLLKKTNTKTHFQDFCLKISFSNKTSKYWKILLRLRTQRTLLTDSQLSTLPLPPLILIYNNWTQQWEIQLSSTSPNKMFPHPVVICDGRWSSTVSEVKLQKPKLNLNATG